MATKVTKQIDYTKFEIEIDDQPDKGIAIQAVHDYVAFTGRPYIGTAPGLQIQHSPNFSSNTLSFDATLQIPIRSFSQVCLPYFNQHEYCQPDHLNTRKATRDHNTSYEPYAHMPGIVFYWEGRERMVAFREKDSAVYNKMTYSFFETYVKPTLNNH